MVWKVYSLLKLWSFAFVSHSSGEFFRTQQARQGMFWNSNERKIVRLRFVFHRHRAFFLCLRHPAEFCFQFRFVNIVFSTLCCQHRFFNVMLSTSCSQRCVVNNRVINNASRARDFEFVFRPLVVFVCVNVFFGVSFW